MSGWDEPVSSNTPPGSGEADWLAGADDIFSGSGALLADPRDVRRAETAPMVLTMFSSDGTLCIGSLEADVPPEEEYRYAEEYHREYYSKYPRDPRMLVPLRSNNFGRRGSGAGRRGTSATNTQPQDGVGVVGDSGTTKVTGSTAVGTSVGERTPRHDLCGEVARLNSGSASPPRRGSRDAAPTGGETEGFKRLHSAMGSLEPPSAAPGSSGSFSVNVGAVDLANMKANGEEMQNGSLTQQDTSSGQQPQQVDTLSRRAPGSSRNRSTSNYGQKNGAFKQPSNGEVGGDRFTNEEPTTARDNLESNHALAVSDEFRLQVVSLCKDQDGSRCVQRLLNNPENIEPIFNEVFPRTHELIIDVFGNYVLQKLLDMLPTESDMCKRLIKQVSGRLKEYSFQMYGCRVIQKMLEKASPEKREEVLFELKDCLVECIFDQNANHVAQKLIEVIPEKTQLLVDSFMPHLKALSRHPYGCRVLQCVFERCSTAHGVNIRPMLEAVLENVHEYVMDQYGNYVVQYALLNAPEELRQRFVTQLIPHVYALSCSKFASNVAEKTIIKANAEELQQVVETLTHPLGASEDGNYLVLMMQDQYANYVVQRLLQQVTKAQQQHIAEQIRPHLHTIRCSVYGQHLVQKMECMGMPLWGEAGAVYGGSFPCDFNGSHSPSSMGRGGSRKPRQSSTGHSSMSNTQGIHSNSMSLVEHSMIPGNTYPQPSPGAVALGGQPMLPLATTGGAHCGYGYIGSPTDTMIMTRAPPPPPQQPQQLPMGTPGLAISSQACFPGMMSPPQRSMSDGRDMYSAGLVYTRGRGEIMSPTPSDGFAHPFQAYPATLAPRVFYRGGAQSFYSCMPTL
ncbi:RNA-binding regulatory protein (pumilio family),putative [Trypanosoma brucei gambiense DAL972]|uniref:Pumillio RNA binding protein, putative n=2 Tax=Trypanosoma brucei TaxID=5691 RepID=D0A583_TRYB9|nr:RNA-binding regulatory protein (pumilio family),putative [Trypanosoma brucei gambiense DAL972]RHW69531.1 pumilio/PUF RNA binding protein 2 [Trypanosoma brucei equiperdum]CBH16427.1 RNA-binding regulatory protein (pumilio family),putative [Trypanosoma brucei gambiense DAL972]|eukprot:XP_011778691.1 RNA-binding regulatory protein (pumilio family),putative [Trypanosoma brucei gambiense DAL972]